MAKRIYICRSILDAGSLVGDVEMNPIAVVHWVDGKGNENVRQCFTQKSLDKVTGEIRDRNFMSWTVLCRGDAAIPLRPPKRHIVAI